MILFYIFLIFFGFWLISFAMYFFKNPSFYEKKELKEKVIVPDSVDYKKSTKRSTQNRDCKIYVNGIERSNIPKNYNQNIKKSNENTSFAEYYKNLKEEWNQMDEYDEFDDNPIKEDDRNIMKKIFLSDDDNGPINNL